MPLTPITSPLSTELESALRFRIATIPCMQNLGLSIESMGLGECILRMKHRREHNGIFESFHGGLLTTAADTVACFAIMTQAGVNQRLTTTDLHMRFLGACLTDVIAHAKVIKFGRTLCPVNVDLYDLSEKKVAVAQVTYMRLEQTPTRQ